MSSPDESVRRIGYVVEWLVVVEGSSWASSPGVRASMRSNRGRDTRPELALRSAVHQLGLRYRVNARPLPTVRRTADLVFTGASVGLPRRLLLARLSDPSHGGGDECRVLGRQGGREPPPGS